MPNLPTDLDDYICINGFTRLLGAANMPVTVYQKPERRIVITDRSISVHIAFAGGWAEQSFTGWRTLSTFKMMLLLHAMHAVPFREFVAKVKKAGAKHAELKRIYGRNIDEFISMSI